MQEKESRIRIASTINAPKRHPPSFRLTRILYVLYLVRANVARSVRHLLLAEKSVHEGGAPQIFPDFTRGDWKTTEPLGIVD